MSTTIESPQGKKPILPTEEKNAKAAPAPQGKRKRSRWLIGGILIGAAVIYAGIFIYRSFVYESTDDAYVTGHVHQISPQIDGRVMEVRVDDNQNVKAGDALVTIDGLEYEIALQKAQAEELQAKAQFAQAKSAVNLAAAQLAIAQARTNQAEAQVRQNDAQLELARQNQARNVQLFQKGNGVIAKSDLDSTQGVLDSTSASDDAAKANLVAAQGTVIAAQSTYESAQAQQNAAEAMLGVSESEIREAQRKLSYATVKAPTDGRVGNKNVEAGNRVQAGQTLLDLVEPDCWVIANYKETQLARLHRGQTVTVTIDALPGKELHGSIDSVAPASGAQFALLPADNATGNFTKVVQRVPVKIVFDEPTLREFGDHLRPGLSAVVKVRVR